VQKLLKLVNICDSDKEAWNVPQHALINSLDFGEERWEKMGREGKVKEIKGKDGKEGREGEKGGK